MKNFPQYENRPDASHSYEEGKRREAMSYRHQVLDKIGLRKGAVVLDLGSGRGEQADYIQSITQRDVIRIDPSTAAMRLQKKDNKRNFAVQGDALHLPLADNSVDFIHSKDMLVHIEDKNQLFRELARVVKPLGLVLLTTQIIRDNFFAIEVSRPDEESKHKRESIFFGDGEDLEQKLETLVLGQEYNGNTIVDISPPYFATNNLELEMAALDSGFFIDTSITDKMNGKWIPREGDVDWVSTPRKVLALRKLRANIERS